jgi:hypothetical protein
MVYMDNLQKATELRTLHTAFIPVVHRLADLKEMDLYEEAMDVLQKIYRRAGEYEEHVLSRRPVRSTARTTHRKKPMKAKMPVVMTKIRAKSLGEGIVGRATKMVK